MTTLPYNPSELSYAVYSDTFFEFDREFGHRMTPNKKVTFAWIDRGYPAIWREYHVNPDGNLNRIKGEYQSADLKILVFGDSQTFMQLQGLTWPDLLQDRLERNLNKRVHIINFARNGYGVVQMFDFARIKVEEYRPDLVIFALISDDITRARAWFVSGQLNGQKRMMISAVPEDRADLKVAFDAGVLNSKITKHWVSNLMETGQKNDPLLQELHEQFLKLKSEFYAIHGDSVEGARLKDLPRIDYTDFKEDPAFVSNVKFLNDSGVKYILLHLPRYEELVQKASLLSPQAQQLARSLQTISGKQLMTLGPLYKEYRTVVDDPYRLFMLPCDAHASMTGMEFYAWATARLLEQVVFK